jgi:hypothetical protein
MREVRRCGRWCVQLRDKLYEVREQRRMSINDHPGAADTPGLADALKAVLKQAPGFAERLAEVRDRKPLHDAIERGPADGTPGNQP